MFKQFIRKFFKPHEVVLCVDSKSTCKSLHETFRAEMKNAKVPWYRNVSVRVTLVTKPEKSCDNIQFDVIL